MSICLPIIESCDGCGACCMSIGYPPFIGMFDYDECDVEWLALPRELAIECRQGAIDNRYSKSLPCVWLDVESRKCRNYDHRPSICRNFEMGSESCHDWRKEFLCKPT